MESQPRGPTVDHDPKYATHRGCLIAVAQRFPVRFAIEFGSGIHSTAWFLDRGVFPLLEHLISFESRHDWAQYVRDRLHDGRLDMICMPEAHAPERARDICREIGPADLVLVDGAAPEHRVPTVLAARHLAPLVVLHDSDNPAYQEAFKAFRRARTWSAACPHTTLFSDSVDFDVHFA